MSNLFNAWRKSDQDNALIGLQRKFILILLVICLLLLAGWMSAPTRLRIYIPPDISNGATLKVGEIPKPLLHSFAYEIWQEINNWPTDGTQDYAKNINTYWPYLTPQFKATLLQDEQDLIDSGQLERQRELIGLNGSAYQAGSVKPLSDNSWEVDLTMRLTETKNSQIVKDVEILYPLRVVRRDISEKDNPYGLALAGFVSQPRRIKTFV